MKVFISWSEKKLKKIFITYDNKKKLQDYESALHFLKR